MTPYFLSLKPTGALCAAPVSDLPNELDYMVNNPGKFSSSLDEKRYNKALHALIDQAAEFAPDERPANEALIMAQLMIDKKEPKLQPYGIYQVPEGFEVAIQLKVSGDMTNGETCAVLLPSTEQGEETTDKRKATELNTFSDELLDHFDSIKREPPQPPRTLAMDELIEILNRRRGSSIFVSDVMQIAEALRAVEEANIKEGFEAGRLKKLKEEVMHYNGSQKKHTHVYISWKDYITQTYSK